MKAVPSSTTNLLAYSYILTHEGYPCVFWQDYFNLNLALGDTPNGIVALVDAHEKYAGGDTQCLVRGRQPLRHAARGIRGINPDWSTC
jgi:alpha-amylase